MKKYFKVLLILLFVIITCSFFQSNRHKVHVVFKREKALFEKLATNGKPNLKLCYIHKGEILGLRQTVAHQSLNGVAQNEQKAFYINAYNLAVLAELNQYYPIQSLEDVPGFFNSNTFMVAKEKFNLKSLRLHIINKFQDPRVHFALYLGGLSSPKIPTSAFSHQEIDKKLDEISTSYINDLTYIKIKTRSKLILLPEFLFWNINDFNLKGKDEYVTYLNGFRTKAKQIPSGYKVRYYPYSWKLAH